MSRPRAQRFRNGRISRRDALWLLAVTTTVPAVPTLLTGCAVNPVTGEKELMLMSEAQEISLDKSRSPHQFSSDFGVIQEEGVNRYLETLGRTMGVVSHRPHMPYSFRGVNANHINAYAFPGGSIAVTRGILLGLESEAELAGLLGHEIGHVNARHAAKRQTRTILAKAAVTGAGMYAQSHDKRLGMLAQTLGGVASGAFLAHYSRDDERQADDLGMAYMARINQSPQGMVGLMELLVESSKHKPGVLELMFATHPMSSERLKTARSSASAQYGHLVGAPYHRQRYMDNVAPIRRKKKTILALQDADAHLRAKRLDMAEGKIREALGETPDDYAALVMMAKLKLAQGDKQEALRFAKRANRAYPEEAQAEQIAGIAHMALNNFEAAQQNFARYDRRLAGNPSIDFLQGVAFENMRDQRQAARHYVRYLKNVRQGEQAEHAYRRLIDWGVIKPQPKKK